MNFATFLGTPFLQYTSGRMIFNLKLWKVLNNLQINVLKISMQFHKLFLRYDSKIRK